ncbi:MAG TPA: hypothetical protein VLG73_08220 [Shinella sp.]|nr:hypothetical protein [Shinella sp.]
MKRHAGPVALATLLLSSCGGQQIGPPADARPIPLEAILSQMKCEFALAFTKLDRGKLAFDGWYIDGKLTAKIITSDHAEGSIGTPQLLPLGSGASGGFNFGGSVTTSRTLNQVTDFIVSPYAATTAVCDEVRAASVRSVNGLGVYKWLESITKTVSGEPRMAVTNLSYTLDFGVKRTGNGGLDVSVIGIKASASANTSRDDTNQLVLIMTPGDPAKKNAREIMRRVSSTVPIITPGSGTVTPFFLIFEDDAVLDNDVTMKEAEAVRVMAE